MPVTTASDVRKALEPLVPSLRRLGVRRLGLFGSVARNEANDGSDVDMLVEFAPASRSYDNFFTVGELLEQAVGRRVELVTPESLSRHIGPHILRELRYVDVGSGVSPTHS